MIISIYFIRYISIYIRTIYLIEIITINSIFFNIKILIFLDIYIDIYYSGVGIVSVSANEYDFEKISKYVKKSNKNSIKKTLRAF